MDILGQGKSTHAIEDAEVYRFGCAPHFRCYHFTGHIEYLRRSGCVNVCAAEERLLHLLVAAEVCQQPQFDLAVVRIQQYAALPCHKEFPHISSQLCAHRDILQVRLCGGDTSRPGLRLFVYSVDSAVLAHRFQQPVYVGRTQLAVLPPFQHIVHDGIFAPELFQNVRIGGIAGLGFFAMGQLHFTEQHLTQLFG